MWIDCKRKRGRPRSLLVLIGCGSCSDAVGVTGEAGNLKWHDSLQET